jgi:hypothetical protein
MTSTTDLIDSAIWSLSLDDKIKVWELIEQLVKESQLPQQETFGSKGSDEHIVDTNEMIYPKTAFEILQPKLTIADTLEFREKHLPEILDAMEEYATSSQTERMYSEEQLKLAYMQGYNRGELGTRHDMESYIEFIRQNKKD